MARLDELNETQSRTHAPPEDPEHQEQRNDVVRTGTGFSGRLPQCGRPAPLGRVDEPSRQVRPPNLKGEETAQVPLTATRFGEQVNKNRVVVERPNKRRDGRRHVFATQLANL